MKTQTITHQRRRRRTAEEIKWERYEEEKRKLQAKILTPIEYEKAINKLLSYLNL